MTKYIKLGIACILSAGLLVGCSSNDSGDKDDIFSENKQTEQTENKSEDKNKEKKEDEEAYSSADDLMSDILSGVDNDNLDLMVDMLTEDVKERAEQSVQGMEGVTIKEMDVNEQDDYFKEFTYEYETENDQTMIALFDLIKEDDGWKLVSASQMTKDSFDQLKKAEEEQNE